LRVLSELEGEPIGTETLLKSDPEGDEEGDRQAVLSTLWLWRFAEEQLLLTKEGRSSSLPASFTAFFAAMRTQSSYRRTDSSIASWRFGKSFLALKLAVDTCDKSSGPPAALDERLASRIALGGVVAKAWKSGI
jgi:hypothetical protein